MGAECLGPQFLPVRQAQNQEELGGWGWGQARARFPAWPGRLWAFLAGASQSALEEDLMGLGSSQLWGKEQNSLRLPRKGLQTPNPGRSDPPRPVASHREPG